MQLATDGNDGNRRRLSACPAQRRKGFRVNQFDEHPDTEGPWQEALVETHRFGPAELAAARIDVADWLARLPKFKIERNVAQDGERNRRWDTGSLPASVDGEECPAMEGHWTAWHANGQKRAAGNYAVGKEDGAMVTLGRGRETHRVA